MLEGRRAGLLQASLLIAIGAATGWLLAPGSRDLVALNREVRTLRATLELSEAQRQRLEERIVPASGVAERRLDPPAAAALAGLRLSPAGENRWRGVLEGVEFLPATDRFHPAAYPELARLGILVQLCGTDSVRLVAHAPGGDAALAQRRTERIRDYLVRSFDLDPDRIVLAAADPGLAGVPVAFEISRR
jgi:hypothetical protein